MRHKNKDWKKFVREDISFDEFLKLTLECVISYREMRNSIEDMEIRDKLDRYIERRINE